MLALLRGILHEKSPEKVILDVTGVGYGVRIPLSTFYELGETGSTVTLRITTQVREDAISLYGFLTEGEQRLFESLISVSGVGARLALAVLSGLSVPDAATALAEKDARRLQSVPGIGRKTAERMVLELKDRAATLLEAPGHAPSTPTAPTGVRADVISALINLGYPETPASRATDGALTDAGEGAGFEEVLRTTLRRLHR